MCSVPEHVEGVCDEGHGVGDVPDDDLDEEEAARQPEHGQQAAPLARVPAHCHSSALLSCLNNQLCSLQI